MSVSSRNRQPPPYRFRFPQLDALEGGGAVAEAAAAAQEFQQGYQDGLAQGSRDGYQQGYQQGVQSGEEQGRRDGIEQGRQQQQAQIDAQCERALAPLAIVEQKLEALAHARLLQQRDLIAELVAQVARRVIHAELTLNPRYIIGLVEESLRSLRGETEQLHIFLNPDDVQRLAELGVRNFQGWPLEADAELSLGDCRLETVQAELEVFVEERLQDCLSAVHTALDDSGLERIAAAAAPPEQEKIAQEWLDA